MAGFVLRRLLSSLVVFFAITLFVFVAFFVLPGERVRTGSVVSKTVRGGSAPRE